MQVVPLKSAMARGKHTSAGKDLDRSLRWLEAQPGVKKVVLGFTEACRHRYPPGHLRHQRDADGGFHMMGYSGNGVVNLFVVTDADHKDDVRNNLETRFRPIM